MFLKKYIFDKILRHISSKRITNLKYSEQGSALDKLQNKARSQSCDGVLQDRRKPLANTAMCIRNTYTERLKETETSYGRW